MPVWIEKEKLVKIPRHDDEHRISVPINHHPDMILSTGKMYNTLSFGVCVDF